LQWIWIGPNLVDMGLYIISRALTFKEKPFYKTHPRVR